MKELKKEFRALILFHWQNSPMKSAAILPPLLTRKKWN